ncbi:PE family protein [Mycobacterium sp. M23085]|uniref:PE family protein n=1 Tax=Mycobacterium sp. M23085 TaxID=3378087 RepID=UPI0038779BFD
MSFETTQTDAVVATVNELQKINATLAAHYAAQAAPIAAVIPPGGDVISALTAARFSAHAEQCQAIYGQASVALDVLARLLGAAVATEAATITAAEAEAS